MPIRLLDQTLINQIAAGEVIVRPASVVKELVENSLDAGATRITIEADKECRSIQVTDDGHGMSPEDLDLAICRHATSKIETFDDLSAISTRGFRGEALASIVAVSRFTMTTRPSDSLAGSQLRAEGGQLLNISSVGCPPGTTVSVQDLFFNTPARLKFMKTAASEWGQIQTILTRQALAAPHVGFIVIHAGRKAWETPPEQSPIERIAQLFGAPVAESLLAVEQQSDGVAYRGFVGKPGSDRADRRQQFFCVNSRPITSARLSSVLLEAYKGLIMVQRHPVAILDISIPPDEVDVNVHPTKEEVRFRNERMITGLLHRAVTATLRAHNHVPHFAMPQPIAESRPSAGAGLPLIFGPQDMQPPIRRPVTPDFIGANTAQGISTAIPPRPHYQAEDIPDFNPPDTAISHAAEDESLVHRYILEGRQPRAIGQVGDSYILAELGEDLLFIDQHAAHERVLYQRLRQSLRRPDIQTLMTPIPFHAAPRDADTLDALLLHFQSLGIEIEHFGGRDYVINGVPADLGNTDMTAVIQDLLDSQEEGKLLDPEEVIRDRVVTRMACHAAIKAGQTLSPQEIGELLSQILNARLSFTCPHGRPTMILLTKDQLDRQFKRK